jgi:hypothetical protein
MSGCWLDRTDPSNVERVETINRDILTIRLSPTTSGATLLDVSRAIAVQPLSNALVRLHEAYVETVAHGTLDWASGSPADTESATGDEWIRQRVDDAYSFASGLLAAGIEQLRAVADLLGYDHGFWATVTLARSVAEMSSRAAYLLDSQANGRERARRFANEHLWSLHEQVRLYAGANMHEDLPALHTEIAELETAARRRGFTVHRQVGTQPPRLGARRPGNAELLAQQMGQTADGFDSGRSIYRAYSAITHGTWHGIDDEMWSSDGDKATRHMRDDPFASATLTSLAVLSVLDALERRHAQFGRQAPSLQSAGIQCALILSMYLDSTADPSPPDDAQPTQHHTDG